jgi:predicted metal-binding protein
MTEITLDIAPNVPSMQPLSSEPTAITEVIICTTCRPADVPRDFPAPGAALFEAVQVAAWDVDPAQLVNVRIRGVECMTGCNRACTVTFQAAGKFLYYFGDLAADAETAAHILACAQLHAATPDGTLLRNDRPTRLRNGILARIPPLAATRVAPPGG